MNNSYTSLHNHTDYSNALLGFTDSTNKTTELIQRAYDIGLNGLSITDHEGVSNHIIASKYYNSMQLNRPFTLILGNEIYLFSEQNDIENQNYTEGKFTPYYHFLLQSLDMEGHKQLRQLSSRAWQRAYTYKNRMRRPTYYTDIEEIIKPNQGHIVASNACLGGELDRLILLWKETNDNQYKAKIHNFIMWCINCFGRDNFFFEVQPCYENNIEQITVNKTLKMLSNTYGIKTIVTTDSHFLKKDDSFVHSALLKSKDGGDDREIDSFYATAYLMDSDELRNYLLVIFTNEEIDEIYANTNLICEKVKGYNFEHTPMIPQIPIEKIPRFNIEHRYREYYKEFEDFGFYASLDNIQDSYFFYCIEQALRKLVELKGKDLKVYINRLNNEFHELKLISGAFKDSMASYYTTMSKIIELIWANDGLSMPARGSGAGFLVCYLLEITQIDPVPLGDYFPFWRHLSAERGIEIADIDNDSQNSKRNDNIESIRNFFGEDRVLNVATFSTLTSKTAIERSCKGLGISDDIAGYLKSLIPVERGSIWSLSDCFYGNEEKSRKKVVELINEVSKYGHLKECVFGLEGLVIGRGVHASGILIGNHPYTEEIACIRSPKNVLCSCYDLHDAEYCGWTKVDMLTIIASDRIKKTMDLLIEYGHMEWQGSLKQTYWKYLHPDVLVYENKQMWEMIKQIYSIFQFDTPVAIKSLNQVEPYSVMDLSATNSLLRLMAQEGQMPPVEKFKYYKDDINNWYKDMVKFGLNQNEQNVLKKYLSNSYGLADSQEKVMLISMDKQVGGFTLQQANKLRKSIAKKKADVLEETKKLFFNSCLQQGTREIFANYVWNVVFAMSFGYSFSQLHSYSYSVIALQELNLNYFYPSVYWNTACLTVDSQSDEDSNGKSADYGKIAKSIYKMLKFGCKIMPPDINLSEMSFTPNEKDNTILFGLGGIAKINQDIAKQIINNRPYKNFKDFYDKNNYKGSLITQSIFVQLIKSGCFDSISPNRISTMKWFVVYQNPPKTSIALSQIDNIQTNLLPQDLVKAYKFKQYAR
jgi:DNA polymerase-3 subunit alpha